MQQYKFLKKFGMIYTAKLIYFPNEIDILKNKLEHTNFECALENIINKRGDYKRCINTVLSGLENVDEDDELVTYSKKCNIKMIMSKECAAIEDENLPSRENKISETECVKSTKMICRMLNHSDKKAPGINSFPGDFDDSLELLQSVQIELSSEFCEIISTGYYLPAGVKLQILCSESVIHPIGDWFIRIGAHSDDLSQSETLSRWPCIITVEKLKSKMIVCSAFGGLIYFESKKVNAKLKCSLSNVVESPYFDLTLPNTINNW